MLYSELQCSEAIHKAVERMGFAEMTEVQEKTIPVMLAGRDVIAKAPTGTGKTCAFGIPVAEHIDPALKAPQAVILAPTRELAQQIAEELTGLTYFMPEVQVVCVYGGANMEKQAKRLEKQKRREERQAGGSSSLDDMIAYVDENGNITDTPPQLRPKVEIQLEDIVIATPKKEDIAAEPLKGRVEYFNTEKGYGFIKDLASTEKYFFHISSAPEGIGEGRIVLFELMRGTRGMNAVKIAFAQ